MSGEQDIRKMGGLARKIPITFVTFAIATAAIAGLPPLSGFFSKDEILWFAFASDRGGMPWLFVAAAATALMTAFYMFRLLWLTFFGTGRMDEKTAHHIHESPWSMSGVLVVLAVLSTVGGFFSVPHFLEGMLPLPPIRAGAASAHMPIVIGSVVIALVGLAAAGWFYTRNGARAERARAHVQPLHRLLSGKYYIDELYEALIGRPLQWISDRIFLRARRPAAARRDARRHGQHRARCCRAAVARADRQPALLRVPRSRRSGGRAAVGLEPCLSRPC